MAFPGWLRSPLGRRVFLVLAVAALGGLGAAALVVERSGRDAALARAEERVARSQSAQSAMRQERLESLELAARLLAEDPFLQARFGPATEGGVEDRAGDEESVLLRDPEAVADLLRERQEQWDVDASLVLDADGRVLVRTQGAPAATSLAGDPLLETMAERGAGRGSWAAGDGLWSAVAVPVEQEFELIGAVLLARRVDDDLARSVRAMSLADVLLLELGDAGPTVAGSSLSSGLTEEAVRELRTLGPLRETLTSGRSYRVELGGAPFLALGTALRDERGETVGAVIALTSMSELLAPYRRLAGGLAGLGLLGVILAAAVAAWVARRGERPLVVAARLLGPSDEGAGADPPLDGLGPLEPPLRRWLRDRRRRERTRRALAARFESAETAAGEESVSPTVTEAVIVALENHSLATLGALDAPDRSLERLARDRSRVRRLCEVAGGRFEVAAGQRLLATFSGDGDLERALAVAARSVDLLSRPPTAFDEAEPASAAIVRGRVLTGEVGLDSTGEPIVLGPTLRLVEALVREAGPGEIVLGRGVGQELSERCVAAGIELHEQRGLLAPQSIFALSSAAALSVVSAPPEDRAAPWSSGSRIDERWLVRRRLGAGSGGEVYEALDRQLGRAVALRRLPQELLESVRSRVRELDHWHHRHFATCLELVEGVEGESGGLIVRERVPGLPWRRLVAGEEALAEEVLVGLLLELCSALADLHAQGRLHGHLGVGDVVVRPDGGVVVTDLEIGAAAPADADSAPEVREGATPTVAADVWSLGVLACRALGRRPPGPDSPHLAIDGVDPALAAVVRRCLELSVAERYPSVEEIAHELEGID